LEDGPPRFAPDSTCPVLLGFRQVLSVLSPTGLSPSLAGFPVRSPSSYLHHLTTPQPRQYYDHRFRPALAGFPVRSPLLGESRLISFPLGTEMFHFPRFTSHTYVFSVRYHSGLAPLWWVSPFGHPRVKACLTARRGFSQPTTSFIVSWRRGIHLCALKSLTSSFEAKVQNTTASSFQFLLLSTTDFVAKEDIDYPSTLFITWIVLSSYSVFKDLVRARLPHPPKYSTR
jgi:hypothetical protein